ncbi:tetratricopeptide repeat protein [Nonomuraea turkmeniaca]|uniref:Tetratricopeptide repeat protein n=1 Tax=Nonomuraea turkmeniaca TaxID=103838 RepID=A0A5S4EZB5_9ACTN|nr:BTAD domain-containing putative transcriptional regulator [Nonomuraea turkmeniaca]TMR08981.1 tetratricopeptide repeat protein [Nonomuraea turkmeniaca]
MEIRVLGPVEVRRDGAVVRLGGSKHRALLALLVLNANRVVSLDRVIAALWGEDVPATVTNQVQQAVSKLRRVLGKDATGASPLVHRSAGYVLRLDEWGSDLALFERFAQCGRAALADGRPADAARDLGAALDLWRGPALGDTTGSLILLERPRLEERRLAVLHDRIDADLALGHHAELVGELTALVAEHPIRESLRERLMLALYRSGRQAEALEEYQRLYHLLDEELGIQPCSSVQQLHQQMLTSAPNLHVRPVSGSPATPDPPSEHARWEEPIVPRHLPAGTRDFIGRQEQVKLLDGLLPDGESPAPPAVVISPVSGTAGIGKTALAVHWAHRVADRFPDGQLYVNLRGFDPSGHALTPAEALRRCFDALGVSPQRIPVDIDAQAGLYRSLLAGKRMLVLLDNARDEQQVRPLLPASPGCFALITSRNHLSGLIATEAAQPINLGLLTDAEARELLARRLGHDRVAAEPQAVDTIISRCARLPLALAVMAARAATQPDFPLHTLADQLLDAKTALDAFAGADPATDLRAVFAVSYARLSADAARLFRLLGLHPSPDISETAAASLAGIPVAQARPLLATLTAAQLLIEHRPGRFTFHDLLRAYAGELVHQQETSAESHAALRRVLDHYVHTGHQAAVLINPARRTITLDDHVQGVTVHELTDHQQAQTWFSDERSVLLAAIERAVAERTDTAAWRIAWTLENFLDGQAQWGDFADTQSVALAAAKRLGNSFQQLLSHLALGCAFCSLGRYADAHTHAGQALELAADLADEAGQAEAHHTLAWIYGQGGDFDEAVHHMRLALDLYRAADVPHGQADTLNGLARLYVELGECGQALRCCRQALDLFQQIGDLQGQGETWDSLGYAHYRRGHHDEAITCYRQALALLRIGRDRTTEAETLVHLGDAYAAMHSDEPARQAWHDALTILDELSHPDAEHVRAKLHDSRQFSLLVPQPHPWTHD